MPALPKAFRWTAICLLTTCNALFAQIPAPLTDEKVMAHPHAFAWPMEKIGGVSFPLESTSDNAVRFFNQGLAHLYADSINEAERSFRQVLHEDPACTMGFWGMALANQGNSQRAMKLILSSSGELTEMEKLLYDGLMRYHSALSQAESPVGPATDLAGVFADAMQKFPNEPEAKALWIRQVMKNREFFGIPVADPEGIAVAATSILSANPHHPVLALLTPENGISEELFLAAPGAKEIDPLWLLPVPLFEKAHDWENAVWRQQAALRVKNARLMKLRSMPGEIHGRTHLQLDLAENLERLGRVGEAVAIYRDLMRQPRTLFSTTGKSFEEERIAESSIGLLEARGRIAAAAIRWELWDRAEEFGNEILHSENSTESRIISAHLRGVAAAHLGQSEAVTAAIADLGTCRSDIRTRRNEALVSVEDRMLKANNSADEINDALPAAALPHTRRIKHIDTLLAEIRFHVSLGKRDRSAARLALAKMGDLPEERLIRCLWLLGASEDALRKIEETAASRPDEFLPQARLIAALGELGRNDEAKTALADLAYTSADPDLPASISVAKTMETLGIVPEPHAAPGTPAGFPDLDSLGPARWSPAQMPEWKGFRPDGSPVSSEDYSGKPYLLVLFLGESCWRCMEQLQAFKPMNADFEKAGLPILTMGPDSPEGLRETLASEDGKDVFPFPVFADQDLFSSKQLGSYDQFGDTPSHGLFLIDAGGLIRWQFVSPTPFMFPDFLLEESNRLLDICGNDGENAANNPR